MRTDESLAFWRWLKVTKRNERSYVDITNQAKVCKYLGNNVIV